MKLCVNLLPWFDEADNDKLRQKEDLGMEDFYWLIQGERRDSCAAIRSVDLWPPCITVILEPLGAGPRVALCELSA